MTTMTMTCPSRITAQARLPSPLGDLTLAGTDDGLAGLWFDAQRYHPGPIDAPQDRQQRWIAQAADELDAYWRGACARFDVPLDLAGTPFQRRVWRALLDIARGCVSSYGQVAARVGAPRALRAVGAAVGRNPVSVIVPCHRVLGSDGALTGYAGGLDRKRALLALERALGA